MKLSVRFSNAKQMKHVIAIAIACSVLLVLPACIPNLRNPEPGINRLPEGFRGKTSPDNSAKVGIEEFYKDPKLVCLIHQALSPIGNRELKILNEEVQVARNEILARSGAYLPFVTLGASTGLERTSRFTENGAGIIDDPYLPGQHFTNPFGNYLGGVNLTWQIDIYRQLRNARDAAAQRYVVASERRNYFVTRLVAEIAENYYGLMALDRRLENLDRIIVLQERSLEIARARFARSPRHRPGCPAVLGRGSQEPEPKADRQSGHHPGRESHQLPRQSLPSAGRTDVSRIPGFLRSEDSRSERGSAIAATSEPTLISAKPSVTWWLPGST